MPMTTCSLFITIFIFFISYTISSPVVTKVPINLNQEEKIRINPDQNVEVFLNNENSQKRNVLSLFNQINIEISGETIKSKSNYEFPFHAIGGISNDDGHTHIKNIFSKVIKKDTDGMSIDPFEDSSTIKHLPFISYFYCDYRTFIREIFSSCPSPVFSGNIRHKCVLTFSPFGDKTKISIKPKNKEPIQIYIKTSYNFNRVLVIKLISGIVLLALAHICAKSKVFQVTYLY